MGPPVLAPTGQSRRTAVVNPSQPLAQVRRHGHVARRPARHPPPHRRPLRRVAWRNACARSPASPRPPVRVTAAQHLQIAARRPPARGDWWRPGPRMRSRGLTHRQPLLDESATPVRRTRRPPTRAAAGCGLYTSSPRARPAGHTRGEAQRAQLHLGQPHPCVLRLGAPLPAEGQPQLAASSSARPFSQSRAVRSSRSVSTIDWTDRRRDSTPRRRTARPPVISSTSAATTSRLMPPPPARARGAAPRCWQTPPPPG